MLGYLCSCDYVMSYTSDVTNGAIQSSSLNGFIGTNFISIRKAGGRTISNNGSGSGLAPAQNILAVQVWFGFT